MSTKKAKKTEIEPRHKQVFVRVDAQESRGNELGIFIPDEIEQEKKSQGVVVAIGPEVEGVEVGDRVIYGAYAGENLAMREGGEKVEYKLLDDADVIAFIR